MNKIHIRSGFTLIEVLVVIGIIAILASVVLVAVNPARQFKLARDSQRTSNVNAILNAIHQNIAEHKGVLTCGETERTLPEEATVIKSNTEPDSPGDIADCLVPDYLSAMPFDPSPGAFYESPQSYNSKYTIQKDMNGRLIVAATGEIESSISVTR